jgi:hypothetical protein
MKVLRIADDQFRQLLAACSRWARACRDWYQRPADELAHRVANRVASMNHDPHLLGALQRVSGVLGDLRQDDSPRFTAAQACRRGLSLLCVSNLTQSLDKSRLCIAQRWGAHYN